MLQQQEEDKAQKSMDKKQRDMLSTSTRRDLLLVECVLSLHNLLQYSTPHNLDVASKVTTFAIYSMFFFSDCVLHLQAVFRVSRENATVYIGYHYTNSSSLGMICTNGLMNNTERITNRATANFYGLPTYYIRCMGCDICYLLFGSTLCNVDSQQINSLL